MTIETADETYEPAHIIVLERSGHGNDQLEAIAPDELRSRLDLSDGDAVALHVECR